MEAVRKFVRGVSGEVLEETLTEDSGTFEGRLIQVQAAGQEDRPLSTLRTVIHSCTSTSYKSLQELV